MFQRTARADRNALQRLFRRDVFDARIPRQLGSDLVQQGTATGQVDAVVVYVRGQFGFDLFQRKLDGIGE